MEINLVGFDVSLGSQKPENIIDKDAACPFCDVGHLKDIIDTQGDIILLRNKYNVIDGADQFVIIEGRNCHEDMPDYTPEHMHALIRFGLKRWKKLLDSGKYRVVLFFKNYGPMSGGTIRHPHMQLVGFSDLNPDLIFAPKDFDGLPICERNGVVLNASTRPRVGFGELNILPRPDADADTLADFIQVAVDYMMHHFSKRCNSYNIFFYHDRDRFYVKVMPRFATSPLFIGYNIHFLPNNLERIVCQMKQLYF